MRITITITGAHGVGKTTLLNATSAPRISDGLIGTWSARCGDD